MSVRVSEKSPPSPSPLHSNVRLNDYFGAASCQTIHRGERPGLLSVDPFETQRIKHHQCAPRPHEVVIWVFATRSLRVHRSNAAGFVAEVHVEHSECILALSWESLHREKRKLLGKESHVDLVRLSDFHFLITSCSGLQQPVTAPGAVGGCTSAGSHHQGFRILLFR